MIPKIELKKHLHSADGKTASVLMIISIDQSYQRKEAFEAFCLKMNEEYKVGHCRSVTIIETGYLKRHYLALDSRYSSSEEAELAAIQLGEEWQEEQKLAISKLKMPTSILSWKDIIEKKCDEEDKPFCEYLSIVQNRYKSDKHFRNCVDDLSKKYAKKLLGNYDPQNKRNLYDQCLKAAHEYLLEESSIIFKLVHYDFTHQLYPGAGNAALRYVYRIYFGEKNPLPWVKYDIKTQDNSSKLKPSQSCFFRGVSTPPQINNIKENIRLELDKLSIEERIKFIHELYMEHSMGQSNSINPK